MEKEVCHTSDVPTCSSTHSRMSAICTALDNADCTGEKYREIARAMGVKGVDDMSVEEYRKAAVDAVQKLSVDVGIPTKLEALKEEDLDFLAESAHADACAPGNPKDASVEDLKALFRKLM